MYNFLNRRTRPYQIPGAIVDSARCIICPLIWSNAYYHNNVRTLVTAQIKFSNKNNFFIQLNQQEI